MRYDFVTVAFEAEFHLLRLQAMSMSVHVAPAMVNSIIVISNGRSAKFCRRLRQIVPLYGSLANKVKIVDGPELASIPRTEGWLSQQILKLLVAQHTTAERYLVLDAKTHLVKTLDDTFLTTPDGRAYITGYSYQRHPLRSYLERTLRYFRLESRESLAFFPSSAPPFVMYREPTLQLITRIEESSGRPFPEAFLSHGFTEFFLYAAWLIRTEGALTSRYKFHERHSPTIWEHKVSPDQIGIELLRGRASESPFMSVHRRAYPKLSSAAIALIATAWTEANIFATKRDAIAFIKGFRRSYFLAFAVEYARKRLRKVSTRIERQLLQATD